MSDQQDEFRGRLIDAMEDVFKAIVTIEADIRHIKQSLTDVDVTVFRNHQPLKDKIEALRGEVTDEKP